MPAERVRRGSSRRRTRNHDAAACGPAHRFDRLARGNTRIPRRYGVENPRIGAVQEDVAATAGRVAWTRDAAALPDKGELLD